MRQGFSRGRGTSEVRVKESYILWRNRYIMRLLKNRALLQNELYLEVYVDESYILHHYLVHTDSVFDPTDVNYKEPQVKQKGRRYCICVAISGGGSNNIYGLVPGSVWCCSPQSKEGHKGEYHRNFNSTNFTSWFRNQLLPNLHEPSLIVLDNASYHSHRPLSTPNSTKLRKCEVLAALNQLGISYDPNISAVEAKFLLRNKVSDNVLPETMQLANAAGHEVLFTPPRYSDLQPIELLWAYVKGAVGRQYSLDTTIRDVKERLDQQFNDLAIGTGQNTIRKMIHHVDKKIEMFQ